MARHLGAAALALVLVLTSAALLPEQAHAAPDPALPAIPLPPPGLPPPPPGIAPILATPPVTNTDTRGVGAGATVGGPDYEVGLPTSRLGYRPPPIGVDSLEPGEPLISPPPPPSESNPAIPFGRLPFAYTELTEGSGVSSGTLASGLEDPHGLPTQGRSQSEATAAAPAP